LIQVFLDFDGTIVDSQSAHHSAYNDALSSFGLSMEAVNNNWFGKSTREVVQKVVHSQFENDLDSNVINDICANKSMLARINVLNLAPNENILEMLRISDFDIIFTIFSNSSKESIVKYIDKHLSFVNWKGICSGQELHLSKFNDIDFNKMVGKFKLADSLLFIDDSSTLIDMCKLLNQPSILYKKDLDLKNEIYTYNNSLCRQRD
jgi:hypothetical protein